MGCWSPVDAMKAYLRTLRLCEEFYEYYEEEEVGIEPLCVEYISALAAGNRARVMVDVEPGSMSPSVIALAAAALQTGGRVLCVRREKEEGELLRSQAQGLGLSDVVECRVAERPREAVERLRGVDFAVVDREMGEEECEEMVAAVDAGPRGAVVVVSNLFDGGRSPRATPARRRTIRARSSSVVLPFGGGMEVIRIVGRRGDGDFGRRCKRRTFVVYYEDRENVLEDCVELE